MSITTTMDAINAKILSLNYGDFKAEIKSVDAQESLNGGVSVLVTGYMTGMDNIQQQFTQSFFLAPQDKGYFVLNDMFLYMNIDNHHDEDHAPIEDVVASATPEQVSEVVPVPENNIPEQVAVLTEESEVEPAVLVENGEVPVDSSQLAVESHTKVEEMPKKSYASIVMDMKQNGVPFSSPAPAPRKPQPRKQEQHLNIALPTTVAAELVASNADAVENTLHEEEVEGYSVYIKGLPMNATHALLEEEFKKFGPIKPNGIQIRNNRVCFDALVICFSLFFIHPRYSYSSNRDSILVSLNLRCQMRFKRRLRLHRSRSMEKMLLLKRSDLQSLKVLL
ncbi:putative Ras GTPase-activating protein-binding protein [Helianthus annuus]|nr:putative Ras GTPase-activating protein-binding protein [Helianthus annuus]